jgi:hypothetical protein
MLLVMPGRNAERLLRASFRPGKPFAHGLDTPVLAALGRLRAPRQSGAKHALIDCRPGALGHTWIPHLRLSRFATCCCATAGEAG